MSCWTSNVACRILNQPLSSWTVYGSCSLFLDHLDEAELSARELLATTREHFGEDHQKTIMSMNNLALLIEHMDDMMKQKFITGMPSKSTVVLWETMTLLH